MPTSDSHSGAFPALSQSPSVETHGPVRTLLGRYALAWLRDAVKGRALRAAAVDDPPEFAYLEPFAGADHPLPAGAVPVGVRLLGTLLEPLGDAPSRVRAMMLDEDPVKVDWLEAGCRAVGIGARLEPTWEGALFPEVTIQERLWGTEAAAWPVLEEARNTFVLLDPPNAGRLSLESLRPLLRQADTDLLLRFPMADLRRLAPFRGSPLADLPPFARRALEGLSRLLGDARHEWVFRWYSRQGEAGGAAADATLVESFAERLREISGRVVRCFDVPLDSSVEHFLLITGEASRVLLMNEELFAARNEGWLPWVEAESAFVRCVPLGELELFGGTGGVEQPRERVVDVVALAHALATTFAGRRVQFRKVVESQQKTDLFLEDVKRALGELRRDGRALYRSLARPDAEIAFPRSEGALPRGRSRSSRRQQKDQELRLGLDLDDAD